jgi:hypothetical protein
MSILEVGLRGAREARNVRVAAHEHGLAHGEGKVEVHFLWHEGSQSGQGGRSDGAHRGVVDQDLARAGASVPGQEIEQGGFAAAVGADHGVEQPGLEAQIQSGQDRRVAIGEAEVPRGVCYLNHAASLFATG